MIFSALEVPIGGFKFFLNKKKNGAFPLDLAYPKHLSVIVVAQLQFNLQLKEIKRFKPYVLFSNPMLQTI